VVRVKEHSSPKGRKRGDTRQRVLKAAGKLFATRGYAATSISAICNASGVLPSSIYWEFGNKAGIFAAVLEDSAQRWLDQTTRSVVRAVRDRPGSVADGITAYLDYMAETLAKGPEFLRLMLMVALERSQADPNALEIIRNHRTRSIASVARALTVLGFDEPGPGGATARDVAALLVACFDGAFTAAQIDASEADIRRMFGLLRSALAAALAPAARPKSE
jgi:AcrR family transcriptional regulator